MAERYYLGLDGGGTKTAACILDESRDEIGRGIGGPCNIATCETETLRDSVLTATRTALESACIPPDTRFESVCAGVAGYTAKRRRAEFLTLLPELDPANRHRLEPDYVVAWWGATEGEPGVVVSGGTGSVLYGRNRAGETARLDGLGFLFGDWGSGFQVGRLALRSSIPDDGVLEDVELAATVLDAIGAEDHEDLVEWVYRDFNPGKVASLAPVVGRLADSGNKAAIRILNLTASALRTCAGTVLRRLQLPEQTTIYLVGSLWNIGPAITAPFCKPVEGCSTGTEYRTAPPRHDAAFGAALLAMQEPDDA